MALSFVVGYQTIEVNGLGFTLIAPSFEKVNGGTASISDITGNLISGESVQKWDADGATSTEYFYMTAEDSMTGVAGWFMEDFETSADNVKIGAGEAVSFQSAGSEEITFSGQVAGAGATITSLESGFTMIGNNTPVARALSEITFENIGTGDSIQTVDQDGATVNEYFYMSADDSLTGEAGWFMDDFETSANSVKIESGKGVLFQATNESAVTITIPSAL